LKNENKFPKLLPLLLPLNMLVMGQPVFVLVFVVIVVLLPLLPNKEFRFPNLPPNSRLVSGHDAEAVRVAADNMEMIMPVINVSLSIFFILSI